MEGQLQQSGRQEAVGRERRRGSRLVARSLVVPARSPQPRHRLVQPAAVVLRGHGQAGGHGLQEPLLEALRAGLRAAAVAKEVGGAVGGARGLHRLV